MGEVGGKRVDLAILVFITGETVKADVFFSELCNGDEGSGSWGGCAGLLGSKLVSRLLEELLLTGLLRGKLLLRLLSKLLRLLGKLLLSLSELLSSLLNKLLGLEVLEVCIELLLLLLGSKLLLLLGSKLLLFELLVESPGVELLGQVLVGVEVSCVEDRPLVPPLVRLVCELLPPHSCGPPSCLLLLLSHYIGLELEHGLVALPLKLEGGGLGGRSGPGGGPSVVGEAGGVVGGVLHDLQVSEFIQVSVLAFYIAFLILSF